MAHDSPPVYLASKSPRRTSLLTLVGIPHTVHPSGHPEIPTPGESPRDRVARLAGEKAWLVANRRKAQGLYIGADTVVVLDGDLLEQPSSAEEAQSMLGRLSGRTHTVLSGLALVRYGEGEALAVSESGVTFHPLTDNEIRWYVETGEPMDKAGAYAAQGVGAVFLKRIDGSFHNVVGFPLDLFYRLLPEIGLTLRDLQGLP